MINRRLLPEQLRFGRKLEQRDFVGAFWNSRIGCEFGRQRGLINSLLFDEEGDSSYSRGATSKNDSTRVFLDDLLWDFGRASEQSSEMAVKNKKK